MSQVLGKKPEFEFKKNIEINVGELGNLLRMFSMYMISKSKPGAAVQPTGQPIKKLGLKDGKQIYETHCAVCHNGTDAKAPKLGDKKVWAQRYKQGKTVLYKRAIDGYKVMPPKGGCMECSQQSIKAAVDYMLKKAGITL